MDQSLFVTMYIPIIVIAMITLRRNQSNLRMLKKVIKKKGEKTMSNEIFSKYIGKKCFISTGSFGINIIGEILSVNQNWIEIKPKKAIEIINGEFVQRVKIIDK